jgi:hypothetical protein
VNLVERLNSQIFGPVDWGWDATGHRLMNIGFTIKELKVYNRSTSTEPDHYNSDRGSMPDRSFNHSTVLQVFCYF